MSKQIPETQPTNLWQPNAIHNQQVPFPICGSWDSANAGSLTGSARDKESSESKQYEKKSISFQFLCDIGGGAGDARLPDWFELRGLEPGFEGDGPDLQDLWGPGGRPLCPSLGHADGGAHVQILASLAGENSFWSIEIPFSKIPSYLCIGRNASRNRHCRLLYSYGRSPSEVPQAEGKASSWWFCVTVLFEQICFAHGGGAFPYTVGRIQHGYKVNQNNIEKHLQNDRIGIKNVSGAAWPLRYRLRYSPERFSGQNLDRLPCPWRCSFEAAGRGLLILFNDNISSDLKVIGEDRVILGTDYPFPLGEVQIVDTWPGKVIDMLQTNKKQTNQ